MKAIQISRTGGPDVLDYVEVPTPSPGPGEVLVKAEAIGVNYFDTHDPHRPLPLDAEAAVRARQRDERPCRGARRRA